MKKLKVVVRRIIALSLVLAVAFGLIPVLPGQEPEKVEASSATAERMIAAAEEFVGHSREEIKEIVYSHGRTPYLPYWTDDWCAWFVTNSARLGDVPTELIWNTHRADRSFYQDKGWYHEGHAFGGTYVPKRGDLMFFDYEGDNYCDHIGIVTGSDGRTVYSLEGNLDGIARRRERSIYNSDIRGYAEIHYPDEIKTYTITYYPRGGTGTMADTKVTYGNPTKLRKNAYKRPGYIFLGWYAVRKSDRFCNYDTGWYLPGTQPAGSKYNYYKDEATVSKTSSVDGDTIRMYADWKRAPKYTVKFNANGGKGGPSDLTKIYDEPLSLPYTKPTRSGYTFVGWSKSKSSSVIDKYPGSTYSNNKSCTYYAVWKKNGEETTGVSMERLFGRTRYDTSFYAMNVARKHLGLKTYDNIVIASGTSYPDALSGAYLAKKKNAPILLTSKNTLNKTVQHIKNYVTPGGTVYLLGGTGAIPDSIRSKLSGYKVVRLGGKTRYDTNIKILKEAGVKGEDLLVCSGVNYPDSLSASATGKPILIVGDELTSAQKSFLKNAGIKKSYIIGGKAAVKGAVQTQMKAYSPGGVSRLGGSNRYETSVVVARKFAKNPKTVVLVYGKNFPDGLAAGPLAMAVDAPIILADNQSKSISVAAAYVKEKGIKKSITVGGTGLISNPSTRDIMKGKGNVNYIW